MSKKEVAFRFRYVKSLESLSEHTNRWHHWIAVIMIQNQTGHFPNKSGKSGVIVELKNYHQYVVKVNGSGRLTVWNRKFLRKFNPLGCKSLSSVSYLRKANIPLQKFVFSSNDEKRDSKVNFDVLRSQKGTSFKSGVNYNKICNAKSATFFSPEDSNCMGASQSYRKQRNRHCLVWIQVINPGCLKKS